MATRHNNYSSGAVQTKYQHTDALGSLVAVSNELGQIVDRTDYEPYGGTINKVAAGVGYTEHVSDAATGLTYMQQRYYDPGIGRFLSRDPVTANPNTGANFNGYWYANNNPYRFADPDGRVAYEVNGTVYIPIWYAGIAATEEFVASQIGAMRSIVAEDGTKFEIIRIKNNQYPRGNIMNVPPDMNPLTVEGEGILHGFNGSVAHINSSLPNFEGAVLHDSMHFVPFLGNGEKSDGYKVMRDEKGGAVT